MLQNFHKDTTIHELNPVFTQPLGQMRPGSTGRILAVSGDNFEIERGLLEMGFVEGAYIEILHQGWLGSDPLAVRINQQMTIAVRRCEANAVLIGSLLAPSTATISLQPELCAS